MNINHKNDAFKYRHIGPNAQECELMLNVIGVATTDELIEQTIPRSIRLENPLQGLEPRTESELLDELHAISKENKVYKTYIGMGYYDTITPPVILRNILENPGWYTQYTPYQAEISQGRLES